MKYFFRWYSKKLDTNPMFTRCLTAGAINFAGDTICQQIQKYQKKDKSLGFDLKRSLRFFCMGFFYIAPMCYTNYSLVIPYLVPSTARMATLKKVCYDQTIFASVINAGFFVLLNFLEGKNFENAQREL